MFIIRSTKNVKAFRERGWRLYEKLCITFRDRLQVMLILLLVPFLIQMIIRKSIIMKSIIVLMVVLQIVSKVGPYFEELSTSKA